MNRLSPRSFAFALIASALSLPAAAVPIHATFNGSVTGGSAFFTNVLNEFPVGTAASFDVSFDDAALGPSDPLTSYDLAPVSGTVRLGALEWLLDAGRIWTYQYMSGGGNQIISYGLQLTGTGPTLGPNNSLFGLFLRISPDLDPVGTDPFSVGFRFPFSSGNGYGGETYGYANLGGTSNITRGSVSVPEPSTLLLTTLGLALLGLGSARVRLQARKLFQ